MGSRVFRGNDIYHRNVADGGIIGEFVCAEMNDDDQIERFVPKRKKRCYIRIFSAYEGSLMPSAYGTPSMTTGSKT